jgi:hypothetical protein
LAAPVGDSGGKGCKVAKPGSGQQGDGVTLLEAILLLFSNGLLLFRRVTHCKKNQNGQALASVGGLA